MSLSAPRNIAIALAIVATATVYLTVLFRTRDWFKRNMHRAPLRAQVVLMGVLVGGVALVAAHLVSVEIVATFIVGLGLATGVWGWVRYQRSPYLRRWEATYKQLDRLVVSDPNAADAVIAAAHKQDDLEREQLRAAASQDKRAGLEFRRRTESELQAVTRTTELATRTERTQASTASAGMVMLSVRRQALQADLDWIRALLGGAGGAA